ncbi:hypothetical protein OSC27_14285 [Microbacterium sp. STN6]|uniref:hypothetical protein n=1 Tax=Microbacterium sp. STN6 TaxID=2995588 RepID=UPI002260E812|nr:hypothetical protein [Microbacterium sp. STN6]MCX7523440.1 hypothetical protein [Microbacterium sp. STN6]
MTRERLTELPASAALARRRPGGAAMPAKAHALEGNALGIVHGEGTTEEKLGRLVGLVPMALEVVDEARDTIARLREENEGLRAEAERLRAQASRLREENTRLRAENEQLRAGNDS